MSGETEKKMAREKQYNRDGWRAQAPAAIAFVVIMLVAIWGFLQGFHPKPYEPKDEPYLAYNRAAMAGAMAVPAVKAEQDRLLALGPRFTGSSGFAKAEAYLRGEMQRAGLQMMEQELDSALPRTLQAEAQGADGAPLPVALYPLMPNLLQPMTTAPKGVEGEVLRLTSEALRQRASFTDCIGLLDASTPPPEGFGYDWIKYAQLGLQALVVAHPQGVDKIAWDNLETMVSSNPTNYVRLVASPEIFAQVGKRVRMDVKVVYDRVPTRNLVGVLKAGQQAKEALVVACAYDAGSMLPDLSPGVVESLPVAISTSLMRGLQSYQKDLRRDVIFVFAGSRVMAQDGMNAMVRAAGTAIDPSSRKVAIDEDLRENQAEAAAVEGVLAKFGEPTFMDQGQATREALESLSATQRKVFDEQARYVLNTLVFDRTESVLQSKIAFEEQGQGNLHGPEYAAYQKAKAEYDRVFSASGYSAAKLVEVKPEFVREYRVRPLLEERFVTLQVYHQQKQARLEQRAKLHDLLAGYRRVIMVNPELIPSATVPAPEVMTFSMGADIQHSDQALAMKNLLDLAIQQLKLGDKVKVDFTGKDHGKAIKTLTKSMPLAAAVWTDHSYPAYTVLNGQGMYQAYGCPVELPGARNLESVSNSLQVMGEAVLTAAFGNVRFEVLRKAAQDANFYGSVLAANVGESVIPSYPLQQALLACKATSLEMNSARRGYFPYLLFFTDVYGKYDYRNCATPFVPAGRWDYSPDAALYDENGLIAYIKDEGLAAQSLYKSVKLGFTDSLSPITVVAYRAVPVSIFDLTNPQTFSPYASVELIDHKTLNPFPNKNAFIQDGIFTTFAKPDEHFFLEFKAGAEGNELVQTIRGFALRTPTAEAERPAAVRGLGHELDGKGYLALDTPRLLQPANEIAKSMVYVNGVRLGVAANYGMADERTVAFQEKSAKLLGEAVRPEQSLHQSRLLARDSATYATLNHPVIRQTISEAVLGILWYLGLLVPFVFFFEKLLFAYTDIRKQLLAQLIIFLAVFVALRLLHPAFAMVRSSLMILLGFIIFLFSAGITVLFSGKFQENLESIRKQRAQVSAAEVNRLGVVGTAFMLGLNNMHRRRVRTGFTCATLVLLTFAMICFTSVRSEVVESGAAVGKAPFQGLLVKNDKFVPVTDAELFALQTKYGEQHTVVPRIMYAGVQQWPSNERRNPKVEVLYQPAGGNSSAVEFDSILQLGAKEPLAPEIKLVTKRGWFTPEQETGSGPLAVMLPEAAATKLGITAAEVDAAPVAVRLNGTDCVVQGLFDGAALNNVNDMDGRNLLPFDVEALAVVNRQSETVILAEDSDPKISGEHVVILPVRNLTFPIEDSNKLISSVAVVLSPQLTYKQAREKVDEYLEESGKPTYYGLEDYAFMGRKARKSSLVGTVDLLIPLVIAALTVLNTMKGSVYERREEIFVYNAVGIAPRHIFFMFFAEAFVYAVVGSVLGYVMSQGLGKLLTALQYTGGLSMTFTSSATIYASLAIAASVFLSTYYPARSAMEIAAPAEDSGWTLPEPEGDVLSFALPFTFGHRDRVAILSFFNRYFLDHGEGSSGAFFAGRPRLLVAEETLPSGGTGPVPELVVSIWLKPFDLGVSQELLISLPTDAETGDFIAMVQLRRLSGTLESWKRTNYHFVSLLRRHFLYWRAVTAEERAAMLEEAKSLLREA